MSHEHIKQNGTFATKSYNSHFDFQRFLKTTDFKALLIRKLTHTNKFWLNPIFTTNYVSTTYMRVFLEYYGKKLKFMKYED